MSNIITPNLGKPVKWKTATNNRGSHSPEAEKMPMLCTPLITHPKNTTSSFTKFYKFHSLGKDLICCLQHNNFATLPLEPEEGKVF